MMILTAVSITGLWGSKELRLTLHPDVNFLIGPNGSGKTTVINLTAAALTADFPTLDRLRFDQITLDLKEGDSGKSLQIRVLRTFDPQRRFSSIRYVIRDGAEERAISLDDEDRFGAPVRRHGVRRLREVILEELSSRVNVRWLSIHRTTTRTRGRDDEDDSYESTVDQKLDELGHELIRFFSKISSSVESESEKFQKTVFTSLLYATTSRWDLVQSVQQLDLGEEKSSLKEIFIKLGVPEHSFSDQLDQHFDLVASALTQRDLSSDFLIALVSMRSIHRVVLDWRKTVERQREISKPKDDFLVLLRAMMPTKAFTVNDHNELQVTVGQLRLALAQLSSGEKQMLILLGEALLQERQNWVYIADEPELSLHVKWQEMLTDNLRQINPQAQIILATHSPDIVGPHKNRVLDMEDLLK